MKDCIRCEKSAVVEAFWALVGHQAGRRPAKKKPKYHPAPLDINMFDAPKSDANPVVAAITQLVEWLAVNQHVTGSSPVGGA